MMVEDVKIQRVKLPVETSKSSESRKVESILSKCSCPECDSLKCFILRRSPASNLCNCPKKSKSCCDNSKKAIHENKPKLDINRVISQVNRTVDISTKISYNKKNNSGNGTVKTIIQSSFSCKSIAQDSYKAQDSFSDVKLTMTPLNFSENTAHLSAQIIKAGCIQDFNDCISNNEPYKSSVPEINNVKEYIYTKLKEIYNACSCKVCECIPTTPLSVRKSTCSCKPCQCDDCKKVYNYVGSQLKEKPHVGCPCISCDRKDCQGIVKKWQQTCSCKPCDCLMCTESLSKNCNCAPCACFECKYKPSYLRRNYIVAAVGQSNRSTTCNCDSPCECSNCIPTYGTTALSQDRSTGTVARAICPCNSCTNQSCQFDGENCRCAMQKHVMSKPIERGHHDYDIRNVLLEDTDIVKRNYNREVISMCANVQQQFCMGDDPSQCIQRENRFAAEYIQLSLPNKLCRYSYNFIPCETKSCDNANNTGDCLNDKELKTLGKIEDVSQLHNVKASYCNCEFCKRQQFNYINNHIGNIIQNNSLPNDTSSTLDGMTFKERPELVLIESITHPAAQSSQNVRASQVVTSKETINNRIIEVNHFATDPNSKNSININNKLKRNNTELLLSQRKKLYCVASIIKNFALFSEGSSSLCSEGNRNHSSSLNTQLPATLDPVTSTLLVVPENLHSLDAENWSINNNYFKKSATLPFFNALYNENQRIRGIEEPKFSITMFDYANIQTTILQAQEFSTKLRGLLESYETANNNFRSVSQRLRKLYDEIVNSSTSENKTHRVHFKHNKESNKLYYVGDRISLSNETDLFDNSYNASLITCLSANSNKTILKPILGSHNLLENVEYVRSSCVLSDEEFFGHAISNCCTVSEVNSYQTMNNGTINAFKRHRSPRDICKKIRSVSRIKSNKYAETDFHQTIMFCKSTCTQSDKRQQNENINTEITFGDADFYKDEISETNVIGSFENIVLPSCPEVKNNDNYLHWNVLRKNSFLESRQNPSHKSDASCLEVNIKKIIRIISQEIGKEFTQQDNNMPSQRLHKVPSKSFKHKDNKASFSDITRISDHTVLVNWNIPNNISNIKGYELQMDGRVVKKILNPHCAMAAISSLPQSERILLTILTITAGEGPYSSNTVVYNPRNVKR
ncbi:uncharacterized protein LOC123713661 [Pieris brassicae]|uniref:uncharacterized protein LOC123713661 n=1 Tax=Pieris brassicae TaxID=7116 RepID=UPI001E65F5D8|nr:uncharacterized protein LOC123713661 [Pieris brassicae]XP_045523405.1 uncharacterized protein LOC123713661 [Pieris brassicae]XP_045523406.1 uncharacterized protein LOC123713661 [Pieris brassicae]